VTKASVELPGATSGSRNHSRNLSTEQTIALLTLLKQRTDANVIGFYITNMRNFRNSISLYFPADKAEKMSQEREAEFRKKNFTFVDSVGYDEYYFLRSDKLDTDDEDEFEVTSTTTRGLVSAFSKYTGSRVSNRVVLNRFINLIA
jgi:L-asparaginase/Glu-tRNA(Gln) amidotransferase subunit D